MRAFRGVTPGLRACKAPVQQRPTAPNIVKMAEGGSGQKLTSLYMAAQVQHCACATDMATRELNVCACVCVEGQTGHRYIERKRHVYKLLLEQ